MKKEKKKRKLIEWEIEVRFETNPDKDNNEFMELIEDKIYSVIDEISPESETMSVLRLKPLNILGKR